MTSQWWAPTLSLSVTSWLRLQNAATQGITVTIGQCSHWRTPIRQWSFMPPASGSLSHWLRWAEFIYCRMSAQWEIVKQIDQSELRDLAIHKTFLHFIQNNETVLVYSTVYWRMFECQLKTCCRSEFWQFGRRPTPLRWSSRTSSRRVWPSPPGLSWLLSICLISWHLKSCRDPPPSCSPVSCPSTSSHRRSIGPLVQFLS